jgi:hypothetical protein
VAGISYNEANLAQLGLELGLSLAIHGNKKHITKIIIIIQTRVKKGV